VPTRDRRPSVASATLASIVAAFALSACGGSSSPHIGSHRVVPCGSYCRQAGGYGGGAPGQDQVVIPGQTVQVDRDGAVTLEARCLLAQARCQGAILLVANGATTQELGRADLDLPGRGQPAQAAVGLSAAGLGMVKGAGRLSAFATADVRLKGAWTSKPLTVLAPAR